MNPAPLFKYDQGPGTLDCWVRCIQAFFLRYGYPLDVETVFQAGKGKARPPEGEAATFAEVEAAIRTLAQQLGATVQLAEFDDPSIVLAALHDPNATNPWTIIAGVAEQDLQPGQQYGHFLILSDLDADGSVEVIDSYASEDGNSTGKYPWPEMAQAMIASWERSIDAIGVKITGKTA